jgi:hypothetical protein
VFHVRKTAVALALGLAVPPSRSGYPGSPRVARLMGRSRAPLLPVLLHLLAGPTATAVRSAPAGAAPRRAHNRGIHEGQRTTLPPLPKVALPVAGVLEDVEAAVAVAGEDVLVAVSAQDLDGPEVIAALTYRGCGRRLHGRCPPGSTRTRDPHAARGRGSR